MDFEAVKVEMRGAINIADTHTLAKNVASNGRLFCALLVVANLVALHAGLGTDHFKVALIAALPIGLSAMADQLTGRARIAASIVVYGIAAMTFLFSVLIVG